MDDRSESLNLKIVKKIDPAATGILFLGRHVVLYYFENNAWVIDSVTNDP